MGFVLILKIKWPAKHSARRRKSNITKIHPNTYGEWSTDEHASSDESVTPGKKA